MGVYAQLVPGKKVRKIRRMGVNLCCCFTGGVGRKRVRIGNWWKRGRNRSRVAQSLGFRLDLGKPNSAVVLSADLLLGFWIHFVLVPLFLLLYRLPCLIRQYQSQCQSLRAVYLYTAKDSKNSVMTVACRQCINIHLANNNNKKPSKHVQKGFSYIL